jgi:hypothetical protein
MVELISYTPFEKQLEKVPVIANPRARKKMWERYVKPVTLTGGFILEFGVASGSSIGWFSTNYPETRLVGFDSFFGLPESWDLGEHTIPQGHFSTNGKPPQNIINNFPEVEFEVGLFQDTLPTFVEKNKNWYAKIIHLDADLYSSTKFVLENITSLLVPGTILLFDELTHFPDHPQYIYNRMHEYRAFMEFCEARLDSFKYRFLARTTICQVAVEILDI